MVKSISIILKRSGIAALGLMAFAAIPGNAAITVDGVMDGDVYDTFKDLQWYNDHNSVYNLADNLFNRMYYTNVDASGGGATDGTLNLFLEVPIYARNMIWVGDGETNSVLDSDYVDYYAAGTHHNQAKDLTYGTQTGSEFFELDGTGILSQFPGDLCFGVQDDGGNCEGGSDKQTNPDSNDDIYWQTSLDYLVDSGTCTTTDKCEEYGRTMSLEILFSSLGTGVGQGIVDSITALRLHLSDEMVGLPITQPPNPVPVPAAFWLFGSALVGLAGIKRKKA